jgi:hypothetical protein
MLKERQTQRQVFCERVREPRGAHLSLTRRSPWLTVAHPRSPWITLLTRCECLRRHGVGEREGELGADFASVGLPGLWMRLCRVFSAIFNPVASDY